MKLDLSLFQAILEFVEKTHTSNKVDYIGFSALESEKHPKPFGNMYPQFKKYSQHELNEHVVLLLDAGYLIGFIWSDDPPIGDQYKNVFPRVYRLSLSGRKLLDNFRNGAAVKLEDL